jgi:hypothetical protein
MKSQTRTWLVFALLFGLWGTLPISPFAYFAEMVSGWGGFLFGQPSIPASWQAILIYVFVTLILVTFLLLGRSKSKIYIAGVCALAEMVYHIIYCIRTNQVYPVSLAIAIGLALALLFLLFKAKSPAIWLSDAFVASLAVWMVYDGVVYALGQLLKIEPTWLAPFIPIPSESLLAKLDGALGLPLPVWALLPLTLAILPLVFLSSKREKG